MTSYKTLDEIIAKEPAEVKHVNFFSSMALLLTGNNDVVAICPSLEDHTEINRKVDTRFCVMRNPRIYRYA